MLLIAKCIAIILAFGRSVRYQFATGVLTSIVLGCLVAGQSYVLMCTRTVVRRVFVIFSMVFLGTEPFPSGPTFYRLGTWIGAHPLLVHGLSLMLAAAPWALAVRRQATLNPETEAGNRWARVMSPFVALFVIDGIIVTVLLLLIALDRDSF